MKKTELRQIIKEETDKLALAKSVGKSIYSLVHGNPSKNDIEDVKITSGGLIMLETSFETIFLKIEKVEPFKGK